ncbi:RNA polymerase II transcription factor SIII (Elongin) subunit A domain containing protein [Tylopilus felleus]
MTSDSDTALRRVPSLVFHCQRVLSAHADAITCLGDDVRYDVIKPVLECCSADTLVRLEQSSPYLEQDTSDLWERLCFKSYPLLAEQLARDADHQPESWRDQYFLLREAEANRLEEVASRLRNQRMEAAERKREREVKLTDKLPPAKRSRAWGTPSQPKTLFQKTKNEATKLRRSLYTPQLPPQLSGKVHRPTTASSLAAPSTKPVNSRINVNAVTISRPSASTPQSTPHRPDLSKNATVLVSRKDPPAPPQSPTPALSPRPSKPPIQKKDPMASLFMPKHRALSQLPSQAGSNNRSVPAR